MSSLHLSPRGMTQVGRALIALTCIASLATGSASLQAGPEGLSPDQVVMNPDGQRCYVTARTGSAILEIDIGSREQVRQYALDAAPSGLALDSANGRLYVTLAQPEGRLAALDLSSGEPVFQISVGHSPEDVVLSPDGKRAYVANRFNDSVSVIDLDQRTEVRRVPVQREPVALALSPDGRQLVVANLLPKQPASGQYVAAMVSLVNTETMAVTHLLLPNGSMSLMDVAISPDGQYAYVPHLLARYQLPTTQLERGWVNTNALTIIDLSTGKILATVLLDDVDQGAANPWAVCVSADGSGLAVTHAGTHEISLIDRAKLHEKVATCDTETVMNDLAFIYPIRERVRLAGNAPHGVAEAGGEWIIAEYYSDSLAVVKASSTGRTRPESFALTETLAMSERRLGERLFHDATLCFQQWQSCSSCHPGQGRVDGLNWDLLNDGLGNPRNTKNLVWSHSTPPSMVSGVRGDAEAAVRAGIRHILFAERPEAEAQALDTYLRSLEPIPSPYLEGGKLSESARRGKAVFESAGCAQCHPAPLYTDLQKQSVGTGHPRHPEETLDTPTLTELWRTAPYLNDGRAATMEEVLTRFNESDLHGVTSDLTAAQIRDLTTYVLSL